VSATCGKESGLFRHSGATNAGENDWRSAGEFRGKETYCNYKKKLVPLNASKKTKGLSDGKERPSLSRGEKKSYEERGSSLLRRGGRRRERETQKLPEYFAAN